MFSSVREIATGVITAWSGALGNIPPGWHLCDGSPGTPDLRDKFIPAAGPTFSVGDESGAATHTHDFTGDSHTHTIPGGTGINAATDISNTTEPASITGTTDAGSTLPPYYALAYIIYLGD